MKKTSGLTTLLIILLVIATGAAVFFYRELAVVRQDPERVAQQETQALVDRVSQLIVLPEGEEPTIATVKDPEALRGQAFFAKAKVGDKALIYTTAKKAILYDPVANKILEVAPLIIGSSELEEE